MSNLGLADLTSRTTTMAKRAKVAKDKSGHLTAAGRRALPSKDFALPGKGEGKDGKGSGSYPIPDRGHAKAALSRAAANASPAEQAKIKAKVHAKFPGMKLHDHPRSPR
jgi:hypothetical protein